MSANQEKEHLLLLDKSNYDDDKTKGIIIDCKLLLSFQILQLYVYYVKKVYF